MFWTRSWFVGPSDDKSTFVLSLALLPTAGSDSFAQAWLRTLSEAVLHADTGRLTALGTWSDPPAEGLTWSAGTLAMPQTGREKWSTMCRSGRGLHKCHRNTGELSEGSRRLSVWLLRTR